MYLGKLSRRTKHLAPIRLAWPHGGHSLRETLLKPMAFRDALRLSAVLYPEYLSDRSTLDFHANLIHDYDRSPITVLN